MDDIEQAVGNWHRVYAELRVAREHLRTAEPTYSGLAAAPLDALVQEVHRLSGEEERAMQAMHEAFATAKHRRAGRGGGRMAA